MTAKHDNLLTQNGTDGRVRYIDFAKAIGLIGVLCTHLELPSSLLMSFALPIFFLASGMLFRNRGESVAATARRNAKKFLVPYWIAMLVYASFEMIRAQIIGHSDARVIVPALLTALYGNALLPDVGPMREIISDILSYHPQESASFVDAILPTSCHLWFLPAMFCAVVIFTAIYRQRQKLPAAAWIVLLLAAACVEYIPSVPSLPYCLSRGAMGAAYMIAGRHIVETKIVTTPSGARNVATIAAAAAVAAALAAHTHNSLWIRHTYGPYGAASLIVAYAMGVSASFLALRCCHLLETHPIGMLCSALSTISRHSMIIYMWHFIIINICYTIYVALTGAELVPDPFYMNLFTTGHIPFRVITLIVTLVSLTSVSVFLRARKRGHS